MAEIKATAKSIADLEVKTKVVKDKEDEKRVVTTIKFNVKCDPDRFSPILFAMANEHPIDAEFSSPQSAF